VRNCNLSDKTCSQIFLLFHSIKFNLMVLFSGVSFFFKNILNKY